MHIPTFWAPNDVIFSTIFTLMGVIYYFEVLFGVFSICGYFKVVMTVKSWPISELPISSELIGSI